MSNNEFWLSEAQFRRLEPLLPRNTRGVPRDRACDPVRFALAGCRGSVRPAQDALQPLRALEPGRSVPADSCGARRCRSDAGHDHVGQHVFSVCRRIQSLVVHRGRA